MDPTSRGDMNASLLRCYYERNRDGWWRRHFGMCWPNRSDVADELMLGLMQEARRIDALGATTPDAGVMAAFSASEVACYKWPGDTKLDRAKRAAFCEGAAYEAESHLDRLGYRKSAAEVIGRMK